MPSPRFSSPSIQVHVCFRFKMQKLMDTLRMVSDWKIWDFNVKSIKLFVWWKRWWTFEACRVVPRFKNKCGLCIYWAFCVLLWLAIKFMIHVRTLFLKKIVYQQNPWERNRRRSQVKALWSPDRLLTVSGSCVRLRVTLSPRSGRVHTIYVFISRHQSPWVWNRRFSQLTTKSVPLSDSKDKASAYFAKLRDSLYHHSGKLIREILRFLWI